MKRLSRTLRLVAVSVAVPARRRPGRRRRPVLPGPALRQRHRRRAGRRGIGALAAHGCRARARRRPGSATCTPPAPAASRTIRAKPTSGTAAPPIPAKAQSTWPAIGSSSRGAASCRTCARSARCTGWAWAFPGTTSPPTSGWTVADRLSESPPAAPTAARPAALRERIDRLAERMTAEQVAEAQRAADAFVETYRYL